MDSTSARCSAIELRIIEGLAARESACARKAGSIAIDLSAAGESEVALIPVESLEGRSPVSGSTRRARRGERHQQFGRGAQAVPLVK